MALQAQMNKKGIVKLSWKAVKSYKKLDPLKRKTTYSVWRYTTDGTWELLAENIKKKKFNDTTAIDNENAVYLYKVAAFGADYKGEYSQGRWSYAQCIPTLISAKTDYSYTSIGVKFLNTGTCDYSLLHYNNKSTGVQEQVELSVSAMDAGLETSTKFKYPVPVFNYSDSGGDIVTIEGREEEVFSFQVFGDQFSISDNGEEVKVPAVSSKKATATLTSGTAPQVDSEADSLTQIHFTYTKVKKATGYLIEICTDPSFKTGSDTLYYDQDFVDSTTTGEHKEWYTKRTVTLKNLVAGRKYYFRVTPYYKSAKSKAEGYGTPLETSKVECNWGRPQKVTNLKAVFLEDSEPRADAKLSWKDDQVGVYNYTIRRTLYGYNSSSKEYDRVISSNVLVPLSTNSTVLHYINYFGDKLENGIMARYEVAGIYYNEMDKTVGESGRVLGEYTEVEYMNPSEISFKGTSGDEDEPYYNITVGSTKTPSIKFKPAATTNEELIFELVSDYYDDDEIYDYVRVDSETGKLTAKKVTKTSDKYEIDLIVRAAADPDNVVDSVRINVVESSDTDDDGGNESGDDDDDGGDSSSSSLKVCLDAGHGGSDSGATSGSAVEKTINLKLTLGVGSRLKDMGAKVYYTRTDDTYVSLTDRTDYAKNKGCNLFISLHCNSGSSDAKGTEVYYSIQSSCARPNLAAKISSAVSNALGTTNRGAKTRTGDSGDYYSVIRTSAAKGIPGLIVEHGFISNSSDRAGLLDSDTLEDIEKAEAKAIYNNWKS